MATYKQNCIQCGALIDRDSRFCPSCGSRSPFGYQCPSCLRSVGENDRVCPSCGRSLVIVCPLCGQPTFARDVCGRCGQSLMIPCSNPRCGEMQFFENLKCTACGKKLKTKYRR